MMRWPLFIAGAIISLLCLPALAQPPGKPIGTTQVVANVRSNTALFAGSCTSLKQSIARLNAHDDQSIQNARLALLNCRRKYKTIEFFFDYYFKASAHDINGPPKFDAEEAEDDYLEPIGLQQIEALLFSADVFAQKNKLIELTDHLCRSTEELPGLLTGFTTSDPQLLLCLQVELVRIMTLGITGYDAPLLKSGISESYYALSSVQASLQPYLDRRPSARLSGLLASSLNYLRTHQNFNGFDRMHFLTKYAMPLQEELSLYIHRSKLDPKTTGIFNARAKNIFSPDALNKDVFLDFKGRNQQLVALGRALFFDKRLSGPATRSCATCHQPNRYFTDGLPKSLNIGGHGQVLRNAPTLLYAGYQYSQFWDARAKSMIEQIRDVLSNKQEMAANDSAILARLKPDKKYAVLFKAAFPPGVYQQVSLSGIAEGLSAYVLSLAPRNSPFDQYMARNRSAMTKQQVQGFNLFMGKAQCGTCHFAPLFNGLVPPFYQTTESEIIGVPKTDDEKNVQADDDEGTYRLIPAKYFKGSFKTPTIRNVAKTGPYMHNGSFHTLDKVMDFYNAGGGNGWGLNNSEQTLPSDSLRLSKKEIKAIVGFLNSVTDKRVR